MELIYKAARVEKREAGKDDLALINRQTLRELSAEEVFCFSLAACDDQIDRDGERFTEETLGELAELYIGKPVLRDHRWSAETQTARVYDAAVEKSGDANRLVLRCYMVRTPETEGTVSMIEGGILRECSVGCAVEHVICSICGADQRETLCKHLVGHEYDGKVCTMELSKAADAYEVSLVAVPAQPGAGVVKAKRYGGKESYLTARGADENELLLAEAVQQQETMRYGG